LTILGFPNEDSSQNRMNRQQQNSTNGSAIFKWPNNWNKTVPKITKNTHIAFGLKRLFHGSIPINRKENFKNFWKFSKLK
jgi:hypothetical protein